MTELNKLIDTLRGRKVLIFGGGGAGAVMAILGFALARSPSPPATAGTASKAAVAAANAPSVASGAEGASAPVSAAGPSASAPVVKDPKSPTVQVTVKVFPNVNATVTMGKTRLGTIAPQRPLVLERRRDSGPLDLVIRAPGFVPVHTRAYTFDDNTVDVRLTPIDKKDTIYGYREPLPPEEASSVSGLRPWVPLSALLAPPPPPATPPPPSALPAVPLASPPPSSFPPR